MQIVGDLLTLAGFPRNSGTGGPLPLKCQAARLGALSRLGTDFLLDTSPHPHILAQQSWDVGEGFGFLPLALQGRSRSGKASGFHHQAPGNRLMVSPV